MTVRNLQPLQHPSLSEAVLARLRRSIVNGEFAPGERLLEGNLAEQLEVSRATVRHALHQLQVEGLVDLRPRKGAIVTRMSDEVAFEVCQVRGALEGFAARTSCKTLTDSQLRHLRDLALDMGECVRSGDISRLAEIDIEFHSIICEAASNRRLVNHWSVQNALHGALMVSMLERHHIDAQGAIDLHLQVCAALETRDATTAEAAIRSHYMGADWDTLRPSASQAV